MDRARAIRIAENWSQGHVCTLREGEAQEYHKLCLAVLREQAATDTNDGHKWISVKEKLPECKQSVLMYFDSGNMAVGYWSEKPVDEVVTLWSAWTDDGWFADCDCEPLYWMPLPEPPKGE